jgi:hypothetical protein
MALLSTPRLFPTSFSHSSTPLSTVVVPRRETPRVQYAPVRKPQPVKNYTYSLPPQPTPRSAPHQTRSAPASSRNSVKNSACPTPKNSAPSSPRASTTSSPTMGGSSNGFHPFHGRVSKHFGDGSSVSTCNPASVIRGGIEAQSKVGGCV